MSWIKRLFDRTRSKPSTQTPTTAPDPTGSSPADRGSEPSQAPPSKVEVGTCAMCGKRLRVKAKGVRPEMRLTCKCGHANVVQVAPELVAAAEELRPKPPAHDLPIWAFGNLLYFLYVRFVVFSDTDSSYTDGTVLVFLIPLVLASIIGLFVYVTRILKNPYGSLLQVVLAAYSVWLLVFFFQALDFPSDTEQRSLIEGKLADLQWPTAATTKASPESFLLSCDRSGPAILVTDELQLSNYHWRIPECRRASSIEEVTYVISISRSSSPHGSAKWVLRRSNGTIQEQGPIMVPVWTANVWNTEAGELFHVTFRGSISGGAALVQNITDSRERMDVTNPPTDEFLSYFGLPESRWARFFDPEMRILEAIGW